MVETPQIGGPAGRFLLRAPTPRRRRCSRGGISLRSRCLPTEFRKYHGSGSRRCRRLPETRIRQTRLDCTSRRAGAVSTRRACRGHRWQTKSIRADGVEIELSAISGGSSGSARETAVRAGTLDAKNLNFCCECAARVVGLSGTTAISSGHYHTCALISDGTSRCFGYNTGTELGVGGSRRRTAVVDLPSDACGVERARVKGGPALVTDRGKIKAITRMHA